MADRAPIDIVKRRVDLQFEPTEAARWFPGDSVVETFLNAISHFFPPGEKFFIDSVRHYQGRITDPVLQDQVRRFIHQEAMHGSVHSRFNRALVAGYPLGPKIERMAEFFLNLARRFTPAAYRLAVSCAIEHYTAMLADSLLRRLDHFARVAHPDGVRMWSWHAVEETEHKAVCFDVYRTVMGRGPVAYLVRSAAMLVVTSYFVVAVTAGVALMRRGRRPAREPGLPPPRAGKGHTLALVASVIPWPLWFDYFRPSFHPWDHDNHDLIEAWKRRYPDFGGPAEAAG